MGAPPGRASIKSLHHFLWDHCHWSTTLAGSASSSRFLGDDGTAADRGRRFVGLPLRGGWGLVALFADITLGNLGYCRGEHKKNLRYKPGIVSIIIRSSSIHLSLGKDTLEYMLGLSSTLWAGKCILSLIAIRSPSLSETWETKSLWPWELMLMSQHLSQDPCFSRNLWRDLTSIFCLSPTSREGCI